MCFISKNISNNEIFRISFNKAYRDMFSNVHSYNNNFTKTNAHWTNLEIITLVSALIATHNASFKGLKANIWLSSFFRELDINADFKKELPILNLNECSEECKKIICKTDISFCSPTINVEWMKEFGEYLCNNGANLGVLNAYKTESRDFCIKQCSNFLDIISGECKYRYEWSWYSYNLWYNW